MPLARSLSTRLKSFCFPRFGRLARWMFLSTGLAYAAKLTLNHPTGDSDDAAEQPPAQEMKAAWDNSDGTWSNSVDIDLDHLSEIYGSERPFRIVTMEGFNITRASLQPAKPVESFVDQLGPAPVLPQFRNSFQSPPKTDDLLVGGSLSYSEDVFVGGALVGELPQNYYYMGTSDTAGTLLNPVLVPEPTTLAILGLAAIGVAGARRKRVRRAAV